MAAVAPAPEVRRPRVRRSRVAKPLLDDDDGSDAPADAATMAAAAVDDIADDDASAHGRRQRGDQLVSSAGEIRIDELRYQAFVPPVFIPPTTAQRAADAANLQTIQKLQSSPRLFDDSASAVNVFSEVPRLFSDLKTPEALAELRSRTKASEAAKAEAAAYRPGIRISRGGRAGQELRELARAQQKAALAEQLDALTQVEIANYVEQLKEPANAATARGAPLNENSNGVAVSSSASLAGLTSGSHEFAMLQRATRSFESPFVRLDSLAFQTLLFDLVSADIRHVVGALAEMAEQPAEGGDNAVACPQVTEEDCWNHRPLMRHLVHRNIPLLMSPTGPHRWHGPTAAEGNGDLRQRAEEARRWAAVTKVADEAVRLDAAEKSTYAPPKAKTRKRRRAGGSAAASTPEPSSPDPQHQPQPSPAAAAVVARANQSEVWPDQVTQAAADLHRQLAEVQGWQAALQAAYDEQADVGLAQELLEDGLVVLKNCDIGEDLMKLQTDIAACRDASRQVQQQLSALFEGRDEPVPPKSIRVSDVLALVPLCEALPFRIPETAVVTRELKILLTWRATGTADDEELEKFEGLPWGDIAAAHAEAAADDKAAMPLAVQGDEDIAVAVKGRTNRRCRRLIADQNGIKAE